MSLPLLLLSLYLIVTWLLGGWRERRFGVCRIIRLMSNFLNLTQICDDQRRFNVSFGRALPLRIRPGLDATSVRDGLRKRATKSSWYQVMTPPNHRTVTATIVVGVIVCSIFALRKPVLYGLAVVAFLNSWAHPERSWYAQRRGDMLAIKTRIAQFVESHPQRGTMTLDQLRQAGAIDRHDLRVLRKHNAEYFPISAASPGDAPVFVVRTNNRKQWFYKWVTGEGITWAPNEQLVAVVKQSSDSGDCVLNLRDRDRKALTTWRTQASGLAVVWRPDSKAIAIQTLDPHDKSRVTVLLVDGGKVVEVKLPQAIEPKRLLPEQDRTADYQWSSDKVSVDHPSKQPWNDGHLKVASLGSVIHRENGQRVSYTRFRYKFEIAFNRFGEATVVSKKQEYITRGPAR